MDSTRRTSIRDGRKRSEVCASSVRIRHPAWPGSMWPQKPKPCRPSPPLQARQVGLHTQVRMGEPPPSRARTRFMSTFFPRTPLGDARSHSTFYRWGTHHSPPQPSRHGNLSDSSLRVNAVNSGCTDALNSKPATRRSVQLATCVLANTRLCLTVSLCTRGPGPNCEWRDP
jgi:hypothetical protein